MQETSRRQFLAAGAAAAAAWGCRSTRARRCLSRQVRARDRALSAGGTTDVVARLAMQKLGELTGQSFVVDNKGGANGVIGTELAARATPDGYTLLMNTAGAQTLSPVLYKTSYEALASFEPISHLCDVGFVLIARKDLPVNSLQELVDMAKQGKPLSVSSGSSMISLITEQFKKVIGAPGIVNAQYKGTAPQMQAVVAGEVDFSFDSFTSVEMIRTGKVKALAVLLPQRAEVFPQVPTIKEAGVDGMGFSSWSGLLAPRALPATSWPSSRSSGQGHADARRAGQAAQLQLCAAPGHARGVRAADRIRQRALEAHRQESTSRSNETRGGG